MRSTSTRSTNATRGARRDATRERARVSRRGTARDARAMRRARASASDGWLYCGLDFGTSSARLALVDDRGALVGVRTRAYDDANASVARAWERALFELLEDAMDAEERERCQGVAVDGTSGTVVIVDARDGRALREPYMYNETFPDEVERVRALRNGPGKDSTESASSAACKLSRWFRVDAEGDREHAALLHHADWLAYLLHKKMGMSDFNNALKLGFDPAPGVEAFPGWLRDAPFGYMLPTDVRAPGTSFGVMDADVAKRLGFPSTCEVIAGTTDSVAAFVASKAAESGECATSLGSTLALKLISDTRVDDLSSGVYSHRLNGRWLVGGASNLGGWILRRFFSNDALESLSEKIANEGYVATEDYFDGVMLGFGLSVDEASAIVEKSRPADDAQFVVNILSSIANVEARCYERMLTLGASHGARKVYTAGGGAKNGVWSGMRSKAMGDIPVERSACDEAAYGAALLARQGRKRLSGYI